MQTPSTISSLTSSTFSAFALISILCNTVSPSLISLSLPNQKPGIWRHWQWSIFWSLLLSLCYFSVQSCKRFHVWNDVTLSGTHDLNPPEFSTIELNCCYLTEYICDVCHYPIPIIVRVCFFLTIWIPQCTTFCPPSPFEVIFILGLFNVHRIHPSPTLKILTRNFLSLLLLN